jgi:hypothetical protein
MRQPCKLGTVLQLGQLDSEANFGRLNLELMDPGVERV